jgi:hypothetical protein
MIGQQCELQKKLEDLVTPQPIQPAILSGDGCSMSYTTLALLHDDILSAVYSQD